jgi:hypothetical protein
MDVEAEDGKQVLYCKPALGSNGTSPHYALIVIHAKHTLLLPAAQISVRQSSPTNLSLGPLNTTTLFSFFHGIPEERAHNQITFLIVRAVLVAVLPLALLAVVTTSLSSGRFGVITNVLQSATTGLRKSKEAK